MTIDITLEVTPGPVDLSFDITPSKGDPGEGVPVGGTTGQVLAKATNADYDTEWVAASSGTGDVVGPASAVDGRAVLFDGITGKLIKAAGAAPVLDGDSRLTDARTPTAHKSSHATGGSDALAPSDIGAVPTSRTINGLDLTANRTLSAADVGADPAGSAAAVTTTSIGAVPTSRTITAGTGLSGGGDLTADRTLSVAYGTTAGTAAEGNDSRITGAVPNTRTVNGKALSANIGVGHTVPLPSAIGAFRRIGSNATMTRQTVFWCPFPAFDRDVKITNIWIDTVTGVASCTGTGSIVALHATGRPGAKLASTATDAISLSSSAAMNGAALSSPYTMSAGTAFYVAVLALNGASDPATRGADGIEGWMNAQPGTAPVTPAVNTTGPGYRLTAQTSIPDNPASPILALTMPIIYLSIEAP